MPGRKDVSIPTWLSVCLCCHPRRGSTTITDSSTASASSSSNIQVHDHPSDTISTSTSTISTSTTNAKIKIGTSFEASQWFCLDASGFAGLCISYGIHLYALIVLALHCISNSMLNTILYFACYVPAFFLALISLYMASTTNPGAVPLGARPFVTVRRAGSSTISNDSATVTSSSQNNSNNQQHQQQRASIRRCHKCSDNYKPARAHHDSVTGRCIVKFDHFCPWVGNAIGALNHKFFCLFLFYTSITCMLTLLLLFIRAIHCGYNMKTTMTLEEEEYDAMKKNSQEAAMDSTNHDRSASSSIYLYEECNDFYSNHFVIGLFIISIVFFIFTVAMGMEQLEAIETGKGKIARMKQAVGASGATEFHPVTEEFNEMFGGNTPHPTWHWYLPTPIPFPRGMKKIILGYEWDPSFLSAPYQEEDDDDEEGNVVQQQQQQQQQNQNHSIDVEAQQQQQRKSSSSSSSSLNYGSNNKHNDTTTTTPPTTTIESNAVLSTTTGMGKRIGGKRWYPCTVLKENEDGKTLQVKWEDDDSVTYNFPKHQFKQTQFTLDNHHHHHGNQNNHNNHTTTNHLQTLRSMPPPQQQLEKDGLIREPSHSVSSSLGSLSLSSTTTAIKMPFRRNNKAHSDELRSRSSSSAAAANNDDHGIAMVERSINARII